MIEVTESNETLCSVFQANGPDAQPALDRLVERNRPFVRMKAKAWGRGNLNWQDDLESEGLQGICKAAGKYQPDRGASFLTFAAYWIDQKIRRWLANNGRTVRLPVGMQSIIKKVWRAEEELLERLNRVPTSEEIADFTKFSVRQIENARRAADTSTLSLDAPLGEDSASSTLGDVLADQSAHDPGEEVARGENWTNLHRALAKLETTGKNGSRQAQILRERFGLNAQSQPRTLEEVGKKFHVTRERIRQLQAEATIALRQIMLQLDRQQASTPKPAPPSTQPRLAPPASPTIPQPESTEEESSTADTAILARFAPRADQREAIEATVAHFDAGHRRGNILAFCGTGKTLLALWISERMVPVGNTALLCPSLALIDQSLRVWRSQGSIPTRYLCLCSESELAQVHAEDVGDARMVGVTTAPEEAAAFLDGRDGGGESRRVLLGTYQSSTALAAALVSSRVDLALYDEAHQTACGAAEGLFATTLRDPNASDIPLPPGLFGINRRLFLTATPRVYRKTSDDGEPVQFSMDNEAIYGRRVFTLNARRAIDLGIIRPYRVSLVVCRIPASAGTPEARRGVDPEAAAHALVAAMRAHKVEKAIAFYARVAGAQDALPHLEEGDIKAGLKHPLPALRPLRAFHVNGRMKRAERDRGVQFLREPGRAVVTNVFLLGTGMDLPAVQMVGIMEPRRSRESIIQYAGRAMRRPAGEPAGVCAHIFVPVFVGADQTIAEAAAGTGFASALSVVSALAEVDPMLALGLAIQVATRKGEPFVSVIADEHDENGHADTDGSLAEMLPLTLMMQEDETPAARPWSTSDLQEVGRIAFLEEVRRETGLRPIDFESGHGGNDEQPKDAFNPRSFLGSRALQPLVLPVPTAADQRLLPEPQGSSAIIQTECLIRGCFTAPTDCAGCGRTHFTTDMARKDASLVRKMLADPDEYICHGDIGNVLAGHFFGPELDSPPWMVLQCPCRQVTRIEEMLRANRKSILTFLSRIALPDVRAAAASSKWEPDYGDPEQWELELDSKTINELLSSDASEESNAAMLSVCPEVASNLRDRVGKWWGLEEIASVVGADTHLVQRTVYLLRIAREWDVEIGFAEDRITIICYRLRSLPKHDAQIALVKTPSESKSAKPESKVISSDGLLPLTFKQRQVLDFIIGYHSKEQTAPSSRDIQSGLGMKSQTSAQQYVSALEKKGYIRRNQKGKVIPTQPLDSQPPHKTK